MRKRMMIKAENLICAFKRNKKRLKFTMEKHECGHCQKEKDEEKIEIVEKIPKFETITKEMITEETAKRVNRVELSDKILIKIFDDLIERTNTISNPNVKYSIMFDRMLIVLKAAIEK